MLRFLLWLQARGQAPDRLRLDRATSGDRRTVMDDGARVELINRCLHDAVLDVRTRLAAILILVFGQPLTRIVKLTATSVTVEEGRVWLKLGRVPLPMAPPIDRLVLAARSGSVQRRDQGGRGWLFPGQIPGQHLSAEQLGHRLHQIGIASALTARNAAWATMATEVPAVVLAEKLGFSVTAIEAWADAMGQDRGVYLDLVREQTI